MSIRMRPAPTAGVNGRNGGDGGLVVANGGERNGRGPAGESRMQQYMRRVLEAGQRRNRSETSPPPPAPKPSAKRSAPVQDDGTDDDNASTDGREEASVASVVDAFAATVMTGGTLMVHEWEHDPFNTRVRQKRVGIFSGQNQYNNQHQNAQFLMKHALRTALGGPMQGNWPLVTQALVDWKNDVLGGECKYDADPPADGAQGLLSDFLSAKHSSVANGLNTAFQDLDTNSGLDWEKLDNFIHALCVLMQTSVVVADHLAGNSVQGWKDFELTKGADRFEATDAWRGSRDAYGAFHPEPPVLPFVPGSRWNEYYKLQGMNMRDELTRDHTPYVWLGLFLQFRISAPGAKRGFSDDGVMQLLASIGKHFLRSYASSEYAPNYELAPDKGFTYDSSVTDKFKRMEPVAHGFEYPAYDQFEWNRALAHPNSTRMDQMHYELEGVVDDYDHVNANVFDPKVHVTIVYEVSAEDANESGSEDYD